MLDENGYVKTWNEGAKKFKGYEAHEIIGKHFSTFYTESDIKSGKVEYELKVATEFGRVEDEGWRQRKDGTQFWANVIITRINDESGKLIGFAKVTRDLTERKKMEDDLRDARDLLEKRVHQRTLELEEAVKSRDEFISVASHELKTPLATLKLQAQITKRNLLRGDKSLLTSEHMVEFADSLDRQVDRLRQLVEDMLDVSRIQRGTLSLKPEKSNVSAIIREVADRALAEIEKSGSSIKLFVQPDIFAFWDRYRIEQVVLNLISNAVKYGSGKPIEIRLEQKAEKAIFTVKDSGIGISEIDRIRIFDRFERAISASEVSGLGLGLYISKEIVRSHEGTIDVKSEIGQGSEFIVTIPLKPEFGFLRSLGKNYDF